jgi:hypothetical protein
LPKEAAPIPEARFRSPVEGPLPKTLEPKRPWNLGASVQCWEPSCVPAENGEALLRQKLTGELALRCLMGRSSAFYTGLYADGLLKNDFSTGGGLFRRYRFVPCRRRKRRSRKGARAAECREIEKVSKKGIDKAVFELMTRAALRHEAP